MYGEEFMQNSINSSSSNREEVPHNNISKTSNIGTGVIQMENSINNIRDLETEPNCKGKQENFLLIIFGH